MRLQSYDFLGNISKRRLKSVFFEENLPMYKTGSKKAEMNNLR